MTEPYPLLPFEAIEDGLTVRITPQTHEKTELLHEEDGRPFFQSYSRIEYLEAEVKADSDSSAIAAGTIPNEQYERLRTVAASVLRRTLVWLRDCADDMDVDVRLHSLSFIGFLDDAGERVEARIVGRPNRSMQDVGRVFHPEAWPTIARRVREQQHVPVERALLLDARWYLKTAAYDQALVLAAVVIEGALTDLVKAVLDSVGERGGGREGDGLRSMSGTVAGWLRRPQRNSLLLAARVLTEDEAKLAKAVADMRDKLVHPDRTRLMVSETEARDAVNLAQAIRKRLDEMVSESPGPS